MIINCLKNTFIINLYLLTLNLAKVESKNLTRDDDGKQSKSGDNYYFTPI